MNDLEASYAEYDLRRWINGLEAAHGKIKKLASAVTVESNIAVDDVIARREPFAVEIDVLDLTMLIVPNTATGKK